MHESASSRRKISRRTIVLSAVAVVLILVIVMAFVVPRLSPPVKSKEKVLVVGTSDVLLGIDPYDMRGYIGHMMSSLIYDAPTRVVYTSKGPEVKPCLAIRWDIRDGGTVWDLELRRDVFFHDGTPFNASAFKFSQDRTDKGGKGESFDIADYVKSVDVLDAYKVRFTLYSPFTGFDSILAESLAGAVSPTAVKKWGDQYSTKSLVGTGPFKFESWIPDDQVVVIKNPNYWDKERIPKIDKFVLKFFKDPSTLKMALEKGEIDAVHKNLLTTDIPALQKNPNLNVYRGLQPIVRMFQMNMYPNAPGGKYFSNNLVRQAIAYAIDYDSICKLRGGERAYGIWRSDVVVPDVSADPQKDFKYDPTKAKQLLAQAGYPSGIPQPLEMIISPDSYGPEEVEMASIIKNNLAAIGITVDIRPVSSALRVTILNSRNSTISLNQAQALAADPDEQAAGWFYSKATLAKRFGLNNTEVDQLVLQGKAAVDIQQKIEIYRKMQMIVDAQNLLRGTIFLYWAYTEVVAWKYVKGDLTPYPMSRYSIDWTQADMDPERKVS